MVLPVFLLSVLGIASSALSADDHSSSEAIASASSALRPLPSPADLQSLADQVVNESFTSVPPISNEDRYDLNRRLLSRDWSRGGAATSSAVCHYNGADTIVIAFEGTGAFDARLAPAVQRMTEQLNARGVDVNNPLYQPGDFISNALKKKTGKDPHWSGLDRGILSQTMRNAGLSKSTQWMSFPSEEFEALSDMDAYSKVTTDQLITEGVLSSHVASRNLLQSQDCLSEMLREAKKLGKKPHVVVVSHSSGARSAVKFAEALKTNFDPRKGAMGINVDLMYTIDPVKEAHEAVQEALHELVNKGTEHNWNRVRTFVGAAPNPVYPPLVRSTVQASSLYKPGNVTRSVNYFQTVDEEGLKVGPRFGIQGSPMMGADKNTQLGASDGLGTAGH